MGEFRRTRLMRTLIQAYVHLDNANYVAECFDLPVKVRADSLQGAIEQLQGAIQSYLAGKNLLALGFDAQARLFVTFHFGRLLGDDF